MFSISDPTISGGFLFVRTDVVVSIGFKFLVPVLFLQQTWLGFNVLFPKTRHFLLSR